MLEEKIRQFINYVSNNPLEDIYEVSTRFLEGMNESPVSKKIVTPEILKLPPAKRKLVTNIVKTKTNCEISSSEDYSKNYVKIKEYGEVIKEVPSFTKKLKWLFK